MDPLQENVEYELLDIGWQLNYEFEQSSSPHFVADDSDISGREPSQPVIEYDSNGVPLGGSMEEIKLRAKMISEFFHLWSNKNPERKVFNVAINEYIFVKGISVIEAIEHAAKSYKSTISVFALEEVLLNARPIQRVPIKTGNANQAGFEYMIAMCYKMQDVGTVKLTVGVKRKRDDLGNQQKIQYGISVLRPEDPFINSKINKDRKKAPHRKR